MPVFNFNCPPVNERNPLERPLVFTWDSDAGEVSGPDAAAVRSAAAAGSIDAHPLPWAWTFSAEPLKSFTDMAAIVGLDWQLPPELIEHYPQYEGDGHPLDDDGQPLAGFCF